MAPLFAHYGVSVWLPELGGELDPEIAAHDELMVLLSILAKREAVRARMRARTSMTIQAQFDAGMRRSACGLGTACAGGPRCRSESPILVSVSVFPLPDDATARSVYNLVQGEAKMTIWSADDGDDTPRPGDSVSGYRWGHNRRRHRYLICTRAVRTDRATGDWLEPWLRAASGRAHAICGPQNHHGD